MPDQCVVRRGVHQARGALPFFAKPQAKAVWRQDNRHPVVNRFHRIIRAAGDDGAGPHSVFPRSPLLPDPGKGDGLFIRA